MEKRIFDAIEATKVAVPGYFEKTCQSRIEGPNSCGSTINGLKSVEEVEAALKAATWHSMWYPTVEEGCQMYITYDLSGKLGVTNLMHLDRDKHIILDDRKNTGKVSATIKMDDRNMLPEIEFVCIILGPEQGKEVVFTFHPGFPVKPSKVECQPGMHGREITVREAIDLGLTNAKII